MLEEESSLEVPVLGPLLFLLYINDLPQNMQAQVRLFANDMDVYLTVGSLDDRDTLQADLDTFQESEFSPSKSAFEHPIFSS